MKNQLFCEFYAHEIIQIEENYYYLYKSDANAMKLGQKEMDLIDSLSNIIPVMDIHEKVKIKDRIGFKIQADSIDLMAFEIRKNQDKLKYYAYRLANILHKLHKVDLSKIPNKLINIRSLERIEESIKKMKYLTEYKEQLLKIYSNISKGSSLCHLDLGPYHILKINGEDYLIDLHSLSIGNPMADIAKTIFWICSGFVPGIGTYLMTEEAKRNFVQFFIEKYESEINYNQDEVNQWLVLLAALEFDTEFPEDGMTKDLVAMKRLVEGYFAGEELDYLGLLIWFDD
jgi:hypothetical protein